jgi:hypothetical protein
MKTLGRILIILLAAAIVIGGTYALSQTAAFSALVGQPMGEGGENGNRPARPDFASRQGTPTGEMRGDHEGQGGSWETVGRNLIQIAAIVAAVQVVWSIGRKIKRSAERHNRVAVSRSS